MSNQHLMQLTGNENTSKTVFSERMEIAETSQHLEMLWFCLCYAEVLDLLRWMVHCVCNPWAKPKLSVTDNRERPLEVFHFCEKIVCFYSKRRAFSSVFLLGIFLLWRTLLMGLWHVEVWIDHLSQWSYPVIKKKKKKDISPASLESVLRAVL